MPELTVRFDGDWRVGTGKGLRGEVDERVRRDAAGLPVVPARTLTGMWRDGCERVAAALDSAPGGPWHDWVTVLFGSQPNLPDHDHAPIPATLSVRTATVSAGLRAALTAAPRLAASLHGVRPGVSLDSQTHHPKDKHLRMVETTRGGLTLHAPVTLTAEGWTDVQRHTAAVLLVLGAQQTRAIGGGRRRGLGRCTMELSDVDEQVQALLDAEKPPRPAPTPVPTEPVVVPAVAATDGWVTLRLRVRCVDPVLSRSVATDGEVRGLPYVPGARVLPVVVAKAIASGVDIQPLIADAGIVCEPLVPAVADERARPAPRCLVAPKRSGSDGVLTNRLRAAAAEGSKPLREHWILPSTGASAVVFRPALDIQMHNTVQDSVQRPTTTFGGLYSYQSIPAGSDLAGRVRLRCSTGQADALAEALTGPWRLGTAKKDDYGRVQVTASVEADPPRQHDDRAVAVVWLLTDTVLMDPTLTPVSTIDGVVAVIGAALGADVELTAPAPGQISQAVVFGRTEGWHTRWTRPRPTLVTVVAGSVLALRRTDGYPIPGAALTALERDGLGERRAEGLGRVIVNDPLLDVAELTRRQRPPDPGPVLAPAELTGDDQRLLEELRRTALRREVDEQAATLDGSALGELATTSASQRGNLQVMLRSALSAPDPRWVIERFIAGLSAATVRGSRWSPGATDALRDLARPGGVWQVLGIDPDDQIADLDVWAVRRVLAHLQTGGRAATATTTTGGAGDGA